MDSLDVVVYGDYFPYGMIMPGRHSVDNEYRYGFQGQEMDDEVEKGHGNSINYKYRMHDPRIGRFFARDPLESTYSRYSPYQFSGNKPIMGRELEGLESETDAEPETNYAQSYTPNNKGYLVIVFAESDSRRVRNEIDNHGAEFDVIYATSFEDAVKQTNKYVSQNGELNTLLYVTHGLLEGGTYAPLGIRLDAGGGPASSLRLRNLKDYPIPKIKEKWSDKKKSRKTSEAYRNSGLSETEISKINNVVSLMNSVKEGAA